jgi:GTPase SAR1 family protein
LVIIGSELSQRAMILATSLDAIKQFLEILPLTKAIVPVVTWAFKNLVAFVTILLIFIIAIAAFFGIELLFSSNQFPGLTLLSLLLATFVGACTLLVALVFFPPVKQAFQNISPTGKALAPADAAKENTFNLVLYGLRGSGKTTLIKKLLTIDELGLEPSTTASQIYQGQIMPNLTADQPINLRVADYYGEKPSNFLDMVKSEFTTSNGDSIVNTIIFFVDIAPRGMDMDGSLMADDQMIAAMDIQQVTNRITEHEDYISRSILEVLFSQIGNENLHSVRLLINKADLAAAIYAKQGLKRKFDSPESWVRSLVSRIDASLQQVSQSQNLDYSSHFVSLTKSTNIDWLKSLKGM